MKTLAAGEPAALRQQRDSDRPAGRSGGEGQAISVSPIGR